jgi:hypothetical protein
MILTKNTPGTAVEFNFSTIYQNKRLNFTLKPVSDYFSVFLKDKLIGQITIGPERHTWHVIDSNYLDYKLVKEIGQKIVEHAI